MSKTLLILLGIFFVGALSAKTMNKMNFPMNGNAFVVNGSTNTVTHYAQLPPSENWTTFQNSSQKFYSFTNTLELDQIESTSFVVDFDYKLKITGTLNVWKIGSGDPEPAQNITLEINYDPNTQKTSRRIDYYAYSNVYKSEFIIESVTLTSVASPSDLYEKVASIVELNFGIEQTSFLKPIFSNAPLFYKPCVDNTTNELILSWNIVSYAEEYELEITFKDNYSNNFSTPLPASALRYDFKENSTRIVTKQNYYRIPLVYERGYLLYRVRAVGMGGVDWNKRIPCAWSAGDPFGSVAAFTNKYGPIPSHMGDKINWQLSTTYSDDGKRKDVVQYYDGLFMNRQTVTGVSQLKNMFTQNVLDNSKPNKYKLDDLERKQVLGKVNEVGEQDKSLPIPAGNVSLSPATGISHLPLFPVGCTFYGSEKIKEIIAQEVIYDFNGRPALQILPVPTGTHKITYIKKLNKNIAGSSYSWKDFDTVNNCLLTAHPMSDVASGNALGAGVYYSQKNPNKLGFNAFIPDSKGYPFSRVQYTFDNTGRTYRQAGVGIVHALDIPNLVGHETKFYYAKPNQVELDRMFGNEVGYAERYQKNMVVDPNGQVSVSYLNPEGKTIATALTGLKPDNLIPLDNESNPEVTIHVDLLASNTPDSLEHSLTVNEQFNVAAEAEYKFDYSVNGEKLSYSYCLNNNICLDCIYDLEIKLIYNEACSTIPIFSYNGTFGDLVNPNNPGQLNMDLSCMNSSRNLDTLVTLQAGSYTLVKTLKVNKFAADAYVKLVFKDTCQSVLQEFLDEEINKIDTMDCYQADLSPKPLNECDRARYMMLVDVSPGGQYAQYDITNITINGVVTTIYDASNYPLSVFNPANVLPTHPNWINLGLKLPDGVTPIPDLQSLILNWDNLSFPGIFLQYHPEYCMLDWCDNQNFGKDYDLKLNEALTFQAAIDSTLISTTSTDPIYKQIFDNDPYFHTAPNIALGNDFLAFLAHPCGGTKNLDSFAKEAAYCQAQPASQAIISNMQNNSTNNTPYANPSIPTCVIPSGYHTPGNSAYHAFGSDPATKDYEWQNLRNLYLTYKEKYLYESRRDYSINNGCFNGCIGVQNFWFYPMPLNFSGSSSYPNFSGSGTFNGNSWSAEGHIPINSTDPCGNTRYLYEHKVKRFTNRYDAFSNTTTDIPINLAGVNLYDPCATEANINVIQPQVGAVVSQYLCDSLNVSGPVAPRDSCWSSDFTSMLNQNLPNVTVANAITLTGNQISPLIRDIFSTAPISQIHTIILSLIVNSNTNTNVYNVKLKDNNDRVCEFIFSTPMVGGTPKPISTVCCPLTLNANTFSFKITFTDGTTSSINAMTKCQMPLCPPPAYVMPQDSCTTRTSFTLELFSFLSILKAPGTPSSGLYHNEGISQQLDHMMEPFGPIKYSLNQKNCTLTFSPTSVQSEATMSQRKTIRSTADIRTQRQADLHPRPKIPAPCTITFSDCDWMSNDATLISIKPFFPNGIANVVTHEFIITYCKGSRPDTFTVKGNSGCFPVNDCKPPYFCGNDTLPKMPPNNYNACVESKLLTATFIAYSNYNKWLDSLKYDLLNKYYAKCMKAIETISYDYPDRQFHYTLYYYDQAGNLVRTVPPAGVQLLSPSLSAQIDSDRNAHIINGTAGITAHTLVTNYAYNSLNQNIWQVTPDAGKTTFYYDKLGRIVASQNAKQSLNNDYSYSWYDKLGRIVESGKIHLSGSLNSNVVLNYNNWKTYLYSIPDRSEITFTQYDELFNTTISAKFGPGGQQNLRGRVASIFSFPDKAAQTAGNYRHATHYTYDVTGNVPIVLQDYPTTPLGTKAIAYNFDLLTGKVNEVRYEPGLQDEFRHKYFYDDELRLTKVQTSTKGIIWETEAEYFYYKHGPLARTELGQLKVQGLDYIYTLQGWIKAVNGTTQDRTQDAGSDGIALNNPKQITTQINGQPVNTTVETDANYNSTGSGYHSLHSPVAADAFGYVLGYYNDLVNPDYTPIDPSVSTTTGMDATTIGNVKPLYNGNISRMYTWLQGQDMGGLGMNYRYDLLNRLKSQQGFTIANTGGQSLLGSDAYGMNLIYDPNGNIMKLDRKGRVTNPDMDKLTYNYYAGTNKLEYINDDSGYSSNYHETGTIVNGTVTDIDDQSNGNYTYDEIGNLIKDNSEGINSIKWNLQNKITSIAKTGGTQIDFAYDALGKRVYKKYSSGSTTTETYYVRDAQGNTISTYEKKDGNLFWQEQDLYGNSRLGLWHPGVVISPTTAGLDSTIDWQNIKPLTSPTVEDSTIRGSKQYELTNHLGNVLATISDRRLQNTPAAQGTSGITADLISATDYYAFGMLMPGRNFSKQTYRYGFNGKENDNDVKGDGNQQDYGMRIYDSRIGKFLTLDPLTKKYPELTPYQFASNTPLEAIDLDGLEKQQSTINDDVPIWVKAFTSASVNDLANQASSYADKAIGVNVSFSLGLKYGVEAGPLKGSIGGSIYSTEIDARASGVTASGNIANTNASLSIGNASVNSGASVGNWNSTTGVQPGIGLNTSISGSLSASDKKNANASVSTSTTGNSTFGMDLGPLSFALTLDPYNMFMSIATSIKTIVVAKAEEVMMEMDPYKYLVPDEAKK
ncbi:MAG: RHS repeat-associated core domain-containing protein [Stygiobacter sp.]